MHHSITCRAAHRFDAGQSTPVTLRNSRFPSQGLTNVCCHDCRRRRLAIVQARQQAAEARAAAEADAAARAAAADEAAVERAVADAASDMSGEESAAYVSAGDGGASDGDSEDGSGAGAGEVQYASELHRQMAALQGDPSELEEAAQLQLTEFKEQVQTLGCCSWPWGGSEGMPAARG